MKKKSFAGLLAGAMAVSAVAVAMPQTVAAADVNPSIRMEGSVQSMVLSMRQVAGVFLAKYPNSAVHSITLKPDRGRFYYEVTGYTLKNTYTIQVDVITGNVIKEKSDKKKKTFRIKSSILTMLLILRKLNPLLLPTSVAMLSVKVGNWKLITAKFNTKLLFITMMKQTA